MEEDTAIAEVVSVKRQRLTGGIDSLEEPVYTIQAKLYLPADKHSNDLAGVTPSQRAVLGIALAILTRLRTGELPFNPWIIRIRLWISSDVRNHA
jgi:hypothetical protein